MELVMDRLYEPSPGGPEVRFINAAGRVGGMLCGDYLAFEKNRAAQLITMDQRAKKLRVGTLPAHDVATDAEFLDSTLLWGVSDNHVLLIQSMALRAGDLERYLNWLLDRAGLLTTADGDWLSLEDRPSIEVKQATKGRQVKSISIKMPVLNITAHDSAPGQRKRKFTVSRSVAADALAAFIGSDELSRLGIDNAAEANLQAELRLSYLRSTDDVGKKVLNGVARLVGKLDTVDADDVQLDLEGIGRIKGSQLRLEKMVALPSRHGHVNLNDAFLEMAEWLRILSQQDLLTE